MTSGSIGERVAAYRHRRGISQVALAGLVGRSESWLSQVERGIRSVDSMSVLLDLARVLKVEPTQLIGRPWDLAPNGDPAADVLSDVRSFLTRSGSGLPLLDDEQLSAKMSVFHLVDWGAMHLVRATLPTGSPLVLARRQSCGVPDDPFV
jgi:transcriptional regulator with XRE-family HTH domain